MGKLIYAINVSLDGCLDHTIGVPDEEILQHYTQLLREMDLMVYGRKTYELMVPYWPNVEKDPTEDKVSIEYAREFNSKKKVIFSRSLASVEANARIARGDLRGEILKLKSAEGGNILTGGVNIPSQLIELGLVDEFRFVVLPVIAGGGRRLLEGISLAEKLRLKLAESKVFKSGGVALRYVKP